MNNICPDTGIDVTGCTPAKKGGIRGKSFWNYTCSMCGNAASNAYSEPHRSRMLRNRMCFSCDHWHENIDKRLEKDYKRSTIIDGHLYSPGNRTTGSFRGMAGRRFDIEYIGESEFAGKRITTFDLWSAGAMPEWLQKKYPDTARFINGASKNTHQYKPDGLATTSWNPSESRVEPYPLPSALGLK